MQRSEQINELAAALCKAQGEMEGASKDKENPHFRSKYADLGAVWDAIREPLAKNGLSVTQWMRSAGSDGAHAVEVETMLMHASGQWISDTFAVPVSKIDAQGYGSAATYSRRYSLMAAVGIAPVDDDANAAVGGKLPEKRNGNYQKQPPKKPADQPPGDPFESAKSAVLKCEQERFGTLLDQIIDGKRSTADQKLELIELLAQRVVNSLDTGNELVVVDALLAKIKVAKGELEHTFA